MTKSKRTYIIIAVFFLLASLFILVRSCVVPSLNFFSETWSSGLNAKAEKEKTEYARLFKAEVRSKLYLFKNSASKSKHTFSFFIYNGLMIAVHKVDLWKETPLSNLVILEKKKSEISKDVAYNGNELDGNWFYQSYEQDSVVNKIYIRYHEDLVSRSSIGDSLLLFNYFISDLSVRYAPDAPNDFIFLEEPPGPYDKHPVKLNMNLALYKKGKVVYFIFAYPRQDGQLINQKFIPYLLGISIKKNE